jgi:hypothetical protein
MSKELPSPKILRKALRYDSETGKLFWKNVPPNLFSNGKYNQDRKAKSFNAKFAGKEALTSTSKDGYKSGSVFGFSVKAHRVAWAIFYGFWPNRIIDHINGNPSDNRIKNLRDVSQVENQRNQFLRRDNKTGVSGIHFCKKTNKWIAQLYKSKGERVFLGRFAERQSAIDSLMIARKGFLYTDRHGEVR